MNAREEAIKCKNLSVPRAPTDDEYIGLCEAYYREKMLEPEDDIMDGNSLNDVDVVGAHIAIFDSYMSDGPSWVGKVALIIFGEVCYQESYCWNIKLKIWELTAMDD